MKILYFAKAFPPETGGVETYSEQVAFAYARAGHEVVVITAHPGMPGAEMRGEVLVHNVGQGAQPLVFSRMLRKLWTLNLGDFDFIHSTTWRVAMPPLALSPKIPLVITVHGREVFVVPKPLRPALSHVMKRAHLIPVVSQPILDKFQESLSFPLTNAFTNWNGISFESESRKLPSKPDELILFCMCRLVERKNVAGAVKAVARLVRAGHRLTFRIAGNGPEKEALASLIREEGMSGHIELLGRISDEAAIGHYRESQIFLHPQIAALGGGDMEGFGLSIADAMAFGSVPVAGASGGPSDFIRPGETGYLVNGEDVTEIEAALLRLIGDRGHLESLSRSAWEFAHARLTWDAHAAAILQRIGSANHHEVRNLENA